MTDIALSLYIGLQGSTMYSKEESFGNSKNKENVNVRKVKSEKIELKGKDITVLTRKCKPATQVINITTEGLEGMKEKPSKWKNGIGAWTRLSLNEKITVHGKLIAESLGGYLQGFELLDR